MSGRLKELIITAGGENIAPIPIEENIIKELSSIVSYVVVVGDKRRHLSCLLTLKCQLDQNGKACQNLDPEAKEWCQTISGETIKTIDEARNNTKILKEIENCIFKANEKAVANPHKVQKFTILPEELSIHGGELGPTLKIKRHFIMNKYSTLIDEMYA